MMADPVNTTTEAVIESLEEDMEVGGEVDEMVDALLRRPVSNAYKILKGIRRGLQDDVSDFVDSISDKENTLSISVDNVEVSLGGRKIKAAAQLGMRLVTLKGLK